MNTRVIGVSETRTPRTQKISLIDRDQLTRMYPDEAFLTLPEAAVELGLQVRTLRKRLYARSGIRLTAVAGSYVGPLSEWESLGGYWPKGPRPKQSRPAKGNC